MIKISVRGIPELRKFLAELPREAKRISEYAATEYLIGNEQHGLAHYPPYKHVSFQEAYGGFVSDKQRRYVMARIREGSITPGESASNGYYGDAWKVEDKGVYHAAVNDVGYAKYLVGDSDQSKMMGMKGWRKLAQIASDNMRGMVRAAQLALNRYIKEKR